jgi:hypothetical protein
VLVGVLSYANGLICFPGMKKICLILHLHTAPLQGKKNQEIRLSKTNVLFFAVMLIKTKDIVKLCSQSVLEKQMCVSLLLHLVSKHLHFL